MTLFEQMATELIGRVEKNEAGSYVGMTGALAHIATEVICGEETLGEWDEIEQKIKDRFYEVFPHMSK